MVQAVHADQAEGAELQTPLVQQLQRTMRAQAAQIQALQAQIEWFKRQILGSKSDRGRVLGGDGVEEAHLALRAGHQAGLISRSGDACRDALQAVFGAVKTGRDRRRPSKGAARQAVASGCSWP